MQSSSTGTFACTQKKYFSASDFYKSIFGCKVYKISLDAGCTCPTRDGTLGSRGCIFCSAGGSGEFAACRDKSISEQIKEAKALVDKKAFGRRGTVTSTNKTNEKTSNCLENSIVGTVTSNDISLKNTCSCLEQQSTSLHPKYIAYFQNFTNTYGDEDALIAKYEEALKQDDIVGISIATRPDCISDRMISYLGKLSARTFLQIELGLQTTKESSIKYIRRCYENEVYDDIVRKLKESSIKEAYSGMEQCQNRRLWQTPKVAEGYRAAERRCFKEDNPNRKTGLHVVTQIIFGLPRENSDDMMNSVIHAVGAGTDGVKITVLYVLRGTDLADDFDAKKFICLSEEEYFKLISNAVELLPQNVVVHRLTGDGPKNLLIAPLWTANKRVVLNNIENYFTKYNVFQGKKIHQNFSKTLSSI